MSGVARLNQELTRLDGALRSGTMDRDQFRAQRRKLLLDFEERQITTAPGAQTQSEVAPPPTPPAATAQSAAALPSPEPPPSHPRKGTATGKIAVIFLLVAALAFAAWWVIVSGALNGQADSVVAAPSPAATTTADLPQDVANALMQTAWTSTDLTEFLRRWSQLAPEALSAARDDPRIWLLRGETDRRLRDAREAASIANTPESDQLAAQLEQVQSAIREN